MNNEKLNTYNLTTLWLNAVSYSEKTWDNDYFECAHIENTQWPNRLWAKNTLSAQDLENAITRLDLSHKGLTLSHFCTPDQKNTLQHNAKLKLKSVQYGMSLALKNKFKTQKNLVFRSIDHEDRANLWSDAFSKAFGYNISVETIMKTKEKIPYYLVYSKLDVVGTVILYPTQHVAGIHSLGVIPTKRKQGFASEIMHHVLNKAIDQNLSLATLQASVMAKPMYLKMGFSIDFIMENYQIQ
ncbi:GNAT family N-acetyltransferase [Aestuariivivens insulae]|uniref:GNAT family N-acetyltransferase n=1 Tax=Aestuariivivens insulae TaxID=1621988 RepID=UPI001F573266|nr:GNAT family N-acetyltransferase [Aestuariivivens insulae]